MSITDLPVRSYAEPERRLTAIERSILVASLTMSDFEISSQTGYAIQTLKNTRQAVYRKLGVHDKVGAALAAGIISVASERTE